MYYYIIVELKVLKEECFSKNPLKKNTDKSPSRQCQQDDYTILPRVQITITTQP